MKLNKTKYVYRDVVTGRLLHERAALQRSPDTWVREPFQQPQGLNPPYAYLDLSPR